MNISVANAWQLACLLSMPFRFLFRLQCATFSTQFHKGRISFRAFTLEAVEGCIGLLMALVCIYGGCVCVCVYEYICICLYVCVSFFVFCRPLCCGKAVSSQGKPQLLHTHMHNYMQLLNTKNTYKHTVPPTEWQSRATAPFLSLNLRGHAVVCL